MPFVTVERKLIAVGRFGAPHGVRGEIRIRAYTVDPGSVGAYGPLTDATGGRTFMVERVRPAGEGVLVAHVAGLTSREAAAALTGTELFARRENMPETDEDEVYVADLLGIVAVDADGTNVGAVVDIKNFGAGDILELAPLEGGETILLPFTKACVPIIDLAARRVVVAVPHDADDA